MKTLPNIFYAMPRTAHTTMDRKDLKELLLETGGQTLACGRLWEIKAKHLGAGVYKVSLTREEVK
jgi:hypothetical protein